MHESPFFNPKLKSELTEFGLEVKNPKSRSIFAVSETDGDLIYNFFNSTGFITARIGAQFQDAGDRNTDLYFATRANSGALTEKFRINSAGNVGIGVNNPTDLLSLQTSAGDCVIGLTGNSGGDPEIHMDSGNNRSGNIKYGDGSTSAMFRYSHSDQAFKFYAHNQTDVDFQITESSATFAASKVTKGGTQYSTSSTTTYTDILTFDTTTNNRAYSVLLSSSENNFSQMYRVSGSVAQSTCIKFELGDSGHAHSKDVEFRITDVSGVRTLQVKAITHTTLKVINVYDVCVALGDVSFA